VYCLVDGVSARTVPLPQHVTVIVRHHRLRQFAGVHLMPANDERDVDSLVGHRTEAILE
jgi:hypothetical protein